jgi:excinuclease UvrABC helicase subunit UvrB
METNSKQIKQLEFMRKHTLTPDDVRKMIAEKLERAEAYKKAVQKRERQSQIA